MVGTVNRDILAHVLLFLVSPFVFRDAIRSHHIATIPLTCELIHQLLNKGIYASVFIGIVGGYYQDVHNT